MKSLAFILIAAMIWLVGLLAFAARIDRSTPAPEPARADGIVALTGPSTARLKAAMQLLEAKKARRLLISGVNREASREDIRAVAGASSGVYDCCVDLGFSAANTVGNAREAEAWAKSHKFRSLIVVTSDYHMPRSVLELKGALPGVKFQAYPVRTEELDSAHWWRSAGSARRMVIEYLKYIVILARESFLSLGPREQTGAPTAAHNKPAAKTPPPHAKAKPAQ
ncbi:MAG: YdcF family protein [Caulobacteraceae bacterium]